MQGGTHLFRRGRRLSERAPRRLTPSVIALSLLASALVVVVATPQVARAANIVVTTAVDEQAANGQCSLREAILNANGGTNIDCAAGTVGADVITFNIAPDGPHTITVTNQAMPAITDQVNINASSQPGGVSPAIEVTNNVPGSTTFDLSQSTNSTVRGFILNGASGTGAAILAGSGSFIVGNWIGTDETGLAAAPNAIGITVKGTNNARIGWDLVNQYTADRNVIAGNTTGILLTGNGGIDAGNTLIAGNFIGTDPTGTTAIPNGVGVSLTNDVTGTTVASNVISGNSQAGVRMQGPELTNTTFWGNNIGLNLAKSAAVPNGIGIQTLGSGLINNVNIGVQTAGGENIISGNVDDGVALAGNLTNGRLFNNYIGTSDDGVTAFGNGGEGVSINETISGTWIGSVVGAESPNVIAYNGGYGVAMVGPTLNSVINNPVRGNSIFQNGIRGIGLLPTGSANDPGDTDDGPNHLQNFPVISMTIQGTTLFAAWTMDSAGTASLYPINIDFYKTGTDVTEGKTWITSTVAAGPGVNTADPLGNAATLGVAAGDYIVATATDAAGNTSEFSVASQVFAAAAGIFVVTNIGDAPDSTPGDGICETATGNGVCTLRAAIAESNLIPGANTIHFNFGALPGSSVATITTTSELPAISGQLTIDGLSQPGANCGVWPPTLKVQINATGSTYAGLQVTNTGELDLRGIVLNRFPVHGIFVNSASTGNSFECNFIGTDTTGNAALGPVAQTGIFLNGSGGNTIGGPLASQRNVIAGNYGFEPLSMAAADNNVVQGNFIGTGITSAAGTNKYAILLTGSNNVIGGPAAGAGNTISGSTLAGIDVASTVSGNTIRGNRIANTGGLGIDLFDPTDPAAAGFGYVGVTFNHAPGSPLPAVAPNRFQNFPVLSVAASDIGATRVAGTLTSTPNRTFAIDVYQNTACHASGFGPGGNYLGAFNVLTNASGFVEFDGTVPLGNGEPYGVTATATDLTTGDTSEFSYCRPASSTNLTWPAARTLSSNQTVEQYITDRGQEKWFKIAVNPGEKVKVEVSGQPGTAISLHRDPRPFYNSLVNPSSAAVLSAEAADSGFLPSGFLPSGFLPSGFLPSGFLPSGFLESGSLPSGFLPTGSLPSGSLPSGFLPSGFLPSGFLPSGFLPSGFLPSGFLPSGFLPSGFLPSDSLPSGFLPSGFLPSGFLPSDAYASASRKSLMAVAQDPIATTQTIERTTFDLQEDLYVRVVGPLDLTNRFTITVTLSGGVCSSLQAVPSTMPVFTGTAPGNTGRATVIVTDSSRMVGTSGAITTALTSLQTLAGRADVAGALVNLAPGSYPRVDFARAQAALYPTCPAATNAVAREIKAVIDAYRTANVSGGATTLQYVVLAGGADVVPFYQVQDVAGLASEKEYVPPVKPESPSEAGLRSGLVKGQDYYGSAVQLTTGGRSIDVPDLAVGRLVETATDITAAVNAYIATNGSVTPSSSLVTGYDFVGDAAAAVQAQFTAATIANRDTLIQAPNLPPTDPTAWTADQLRTKLLTGSPDVMMLAGHFSAGNLLAADYRTSLTAAEIATSSADLANSVILALGCHGGFALPSTDLLAGASPDPDWAKAFLRKGAAAYIAATGYAYGDTELTEYGERLFVGVAEQMRTGTGPIPMGKALVEAKRQYLASSAQITGIDEKTLVEMTLYGLPMMKINMPGPRLNPPTDASLVGGTTTVTNGPGVQTGLSSTVVAVPQSPTRIDEPLIDVETGASVPTTYYRGRDGVVANPFEPILPKRIDNVTASGKVLRGVALRGGTYTDVNNIIPLTTAPATETSRPHQSFNSEVFYPNQLWAPNFYDAVDGGSTRLVTVPAQYKSSSPGSTSGTVRTFTNLDLALYYMPSNWTTGIGTTRAAAVSAGPSIDGTRATVTGSNVTFEVNASNDGSAGVQAVWVLYTAASGPMSGRWQPLDLTQSGTDPTLWSGTLNIGSTPASSVQFMVQAVNGAGLTSLATNQGAYYPVVAASTTPPPPPAATSITLSGPSSGTFQVEQTFSAVLTNGSSGIAGQTLVFDVGGQQALAVTDGAGYAAVTITPFVAPGPYTAQVSSRPTAQYRSANDSQAFAVTKAATSLVLAGPTASVAGMSGGFTATLTRGPGQALVGKSIAFVLTGPTQIVRTVTTDGTGVATLTPQALPPGTYSVRAYFSGGAIGGTAPALVLPTDDSYLSSASATGSTTVAPAAVLTITVAYRKADGSAYTPGTWSRQTVTVDFTCFAGAALVATCEPDRTVTGGIVPASVGTATDAAGGSATVAVGQIQVDATAPSVTLTTPANLGSYVQGAVVNAAYTCADTTSGVATCAGPVANGAAINTATTGPKSFAVTATDVAGNATTTSVSYTVVSAAVLAITVAYRNADGTPYTPGTWTKQNVTVDFTCTPGPLPIAMCEADRVITNGTTAASTGTVRDTGNNTATVAVGQIKVDTVLPTATVTTPAVLPVTYVAGAVVNASFTCADTPSGIASCVGTVASGQRIDTATPGVKSFTVTATDLAGNVAVKTVSYTVTPAVVPNQAPVVRADMGVAGLQEIGYQSNAIVLTGSFTDADGGAPYKASVRWTPTGAFTSFVLNNNSDFLAAYVYPSAGTRVATVRICDKLGACGTDDVTIRSSVSQKVTPVRECVVDRGSAVNPRYQARFGYNNPAPFAIYIPTLLSAENGFTSSPYLRGQPQVFMPGNKRNVFTTTFHTGSISWRLNGTTVTANSTSPRC